MTDDDVKDYVLDTPEQSLRRCVDSHADAGIVCWDAATPAQGCYAHHREKSLMEAIETGLAFTGTHGLGEWVVCARGAMVYVRSLMNYSEIGVRRERRDDGLVRIGLLHAKHVFAYPDAPLEHTLSLWVGHYGSPRCTRVIMTNTACSFGAAK